MFNKDELILDKIRSLSMNDLSTGELLCRLTSLEDPSLQCTAESDEITDAVGALITTLYRAKKATLSATNSLLSLGLAAEQYGTKKELGSSENKIPTWTYEIITIPAGANTVTLSHVPTNDIKYIYPITNGEISGTSYVAGAEASATEFVISKETKTITLPTGATGKIYVEYEYEVEDAVRIRNRASQFPEACSVRVYAYFRDKCNENIVYSGVIICPKAKLNPEQIELALTSTGKHAFELNMMKDYCEDENNDELFSIIVSK